MVSFLDKTRWLKSNLKRRTGQELPLDQLREFVSEALLGKCSYCTVGLTLGNIQVDHKISREDLGKTTFANLEVICRDCNLAKGNFSKTVYTALLQTARKFGLKNKKRLVSRLKQSSLVYRKF